MKWLGSTVSWLPIIRTTRMPRWSHRKPLRPDASPYRQRCATASKRECPLQSHGDPKRGARRVYCRILGRQSCTCSRQSDRTPYPRCSLRPRAGPAGRRRVCLCRSRGGSRHDPAVEMPHTPPRPQRGDVCSWSVPRREENQRPYFNAFTRWGADRKWIFK
jgi:hypothetical protein